MIPNKSYDILKQNSLAVKKGTAKESRINLTLTRLVTTKTDISVRPRSILYIVNLRRYIPLCLHIGII